MGQQKQPSASPVGLWSKDLPITLWDYLKPQGKQPSRCPVVPVVWFWLLRLALASELRWSLTEVMVVSALPPLD